MYAYYILIDIITWLLLLAIYLHESETIFGHVLVISFIAFVLHIPVLLLRNRLKKALVPAILAVFTVESLLQVIQALHWLNQGNYQHINLIIGSKLFISCVLIAPSLLYVIVYIAIHALFLAMGLLLLQ